MRIAVIGSRVKSTVEEFEGQAIELGRILAQKNHVLVTAPNSGIQGLVAQSYVSNNGPCYIGINATEETMKREGDIALVLANSMEFGGVSYQERDSKILSRTQGIIALTGEEDMFNLAIHGINELDMPLGYYPGSSIFFDNAIQEGLLSSGNVCVSKNMEELVDYVVTNFAR